MNIQDDEWYMRLAIEEAERGFKLGEVPVGAILVSDKKEIISRTHNLKETNGDPTAHAEILAIRKAVGKWDSWRYLGATLYVTLEPCPMCLFALMQARISRLVFGAYDSKGGSLSLGYHLFDDQRFNHKFDICGGLLHYDCSKLLSDFFRLRRKGHDLA